MWYKPSIDATWEKLIRGINSICTNLVPSKIIQYIASHTPYQGILDQAEKQDYAPKIQLIWIVSKIDQIYKLLNQIWEIYGTKKRKKLPCQTTIILKKSMELHKNCNWRWKISIPSTIIEEGQSIQAPTKIASILNLFWNIKIWKIRGPFKPTTFNPLILNLRGF